MGRLIPSAFAVVAVAFGASLGAGSATAATACSLYSSPAGSDAAGNGSVSSPWASPQKLVDSLTSSNPTGCLLAGTYSVGSRLSISTSGGTSTAPLTLMAAPNQAATMKLGPCSTCGVHVTAPYFTVQNLALDNSGSVESTVWLEGQGDALKHDNIGNGSTGSGTGIGVDCVFVGGKAQVTIDENTIHDCGNTSDGQNDQGIYLDNAVEAQVTNNVIWNAAGFAIQFWPEAQNTLVAHNVIDASGAGVILAGDITAPSSNNTVSQNIISNSFSQYLVQSYWQGLPGSGNLVANNCLYNGHLGDVQSPQLGFTASNNLDGQNPGYVDSASHNYTLQPGSPCMPVVGYDTAARIAGSASSSPPPASPPPPSAPTAGTTTTLAGCASTTRRRNTARACRARRCLALARAGRRCRHRSSHSAHRRRKARACRAWRRLAHARAGRRCPHRSLR